MTKINVCLQVFLIFALTQVTLARADSSARGKSVAFDAVDNRSAEAIPNPKISGITDSVKPMAEQPLTAFVALGSSFAQDARLGDLEWTDEQFSAFVEGVRDAFHHNPQAFDRSAEQLYTAMTARIQVLDREKRVKEFQEPAYLEKYIKDVRKKLKLQQTDSGLCYVVQGTGDALRPAPQDTVVVSFDVTASDLATDLPQLSVSRLRVKIVDLLPGIAEGIQMMTLNSKAVFLLPPALSYGEGKWPNGVDKNTPLIYRLSLLEIEPAEPKS